MIDLHCHLLPGIDDGPRTLDDALELARACVADGVRTVVATPHIYPGVYDNDAERIRHACEAFQAELQRHGIALHLQWAAEVRACPEALDLLAQDRLAFLGQEGSWRFMLMELPDGQIPLGTDRLVARFLAANIRPVIAHPERNKAIMADTQKLKPLLDQGCLAQVTAGALLGEFGSRAQSAAHEIIDQGWASALASDAHHTRRRAPRMALAREALQRHWGEAAAQQLTLVGPARLTAPLAAALQPPCLHA